MAERAALTRQRADFGQPVGDLSLDRERYRRLRRRIQWADAHQFSGIGLQPFEETVGRRLRARRLQHARQQRAQLLRQRYWRRHAGCRERRERRQDLVVGAERFRLREFGRERRAANGGIAQRRRAQG